MFIQDQLPWEQVNDENLSFFKAIGVDYLTINPGPDLRDGADRSDYWLAMRKLAESHGLKLMNTACPGWDELTLALPDRDEKIKAWCMLLRNMGKAGIPTLGYNFKPVGNFRTPATLGRGGAHYSTFHYDEFMKNPPFYPEKVITEEQLAENMEYFLSRVIPVAEEEGIRMALHPDDPPIPETMGGAARIVSSLDQYKRIFNMVPSRSNAMLFCQGCVTEMGENVEQAIRDIGSLDKIVYVHFRNIRGNSPRDFEEVFIDEGDVDMVKMMQTYKEIGFNGPFMMDHTPEFPYDHQTFYGGHAYAAGYIRALIQTVYR